MVTELNVIQVFSRKGGPKILPESIKILLSDYLKINICFFLMLLAWLYIFYFKTNTQSYSNNAIFNIDSESVASAYNTKFYKRLCF